VKHINNSWRRAIKRLCDSSLIKYGKVKNKNILTTNFAVFKGTNLDKKPLKYLHLKLGLK
jgi:hypothetical protein